MIAETGKGLLGLVPKFWHAKVLASQMFGKKLAHILVEKCERWTNFGTQLKSGQNLGLPKLWHAKILVSIQAGPYFSPMWREEEEKKNTLPCDLGYLH